MKMRGITDLSLVNMPLPFLKQFPHAGDLPSHYDNLISGVQLGLIVEWVGLHSNLLLFLLAAVASDANPVLSGRCARHRGHIHSPTLHARRVRFRHYKTFKSVELNLKMCVECGVNERRFSSTAPRKRKGGGGGGGHICAKPHTSIPPWVSGQPLSLEARPWIPTVGRVFQGRMYILEDANNVDGALYV